jgi:hypothetical protein
MFFVTVFFRKIASLADACVGCLSEPCDTRWMSVHKMTEDFFAGIDTIWHALNAHRNVLGDANPLLTSFRQIYTNENNIRINLNAYINVIKPMRNIILEFQVSFFL